MSGPSGADSERLIEAFTASLADGSFRKLLLRSPVDGLPELQTEARLIRLRGKPMLQVTCSERTRDWVSNHALEEAGAWLRSQLGSRFRSAYLAAAARDLQWTATPGGGRLVRHKPTVVTPPPATHDVRKQWSLPVVEQRWARGLGLVASDGVVRERMADKIRQIARYAELLEALLETAPVPDGGTVTACDMGSGKGYLTFAAWAMLHRRFGSRLRMIGVEARPDLVALCNRTALESGCEGLEFREGRIEGIELPRVDLLFALHACDTATDAAIDRGIRAGAALIAVAPCCHRALRPRIAAGAGSSPAAPALAHGILLERFSEWLTDSLRAVRLEAAGYESRVMEFIPSEHTPKNLLICGLRRVRQEAAPAMAAARQRAAALIRLGGLPESELDGWTWADAASPPAGPEA